MNKKKTMIIGLGLMLIMGMASLAYFTDVKTGSTEATAGEVSLGDLSDDVAVELMVPGDIEEFKVTATYTGNVEAKVRLKLSNVVENVAATSTEGFRLKDLAGVIVIPAEGAFIDLGIVSPAGEITTDLTLELLAASTNIYQNATYSVDYEIQVLQADNTGTAWEEVTSGSINVVGR